MGQLYLVGTPIGNLEDMSFRAIRILKEVGLIAAEDTRQSQRLLNHFEIHTHMVAFHEYSDTQRIASLVTQLAEIDVAVITDAGMPGLSDPGYRLVNAAIEAGIRVTPIPGPTAAISALVSSGLPTDAFLFLGFLPRQSSARQTALSAVKQMAYTLVLYESPHRMPALLADLRAILGDRYIVIGRELTKLYEEIWRGSVTAAQAHFTAESVRGEFTLVVAGAAQAPIVWDEAAVQDALTQEMAQGQSRKEAVTIVATLSGWRKKEVYALALQLP